ncbi:hypothetical protein [Parasedimentitalea huanghaiensis]|uniref:Uncharacterized protein n=1 Tax=Parasedimentitalea huanghaiensis TaxID=2682100 RepID=A0A6L6WDA8_9RHOB|nr:hypothetical protein [Zongyanglinia huanghaiensis]MVO15786.1 hypothetical protein [Zongyanglinia huanghaiensis]
MDEVRLDCKDLTAKGTLQGKELWRISRVSFPKFEEDLFILGDKFWPRWYASLNGGFPLLGSWDEHRQLLYDIALISNGEWEKGAEHIAALIAEIEAKYLPTTSAPKSTTNLDIPTGQMQTYLQVNRLSLPPTLEAVYGHLELEIHRLQGINHWETEVQQERSRDLVRRLLAMLDAVGALQAQAEALPEEPTVEDAEQTQELWQEYLDLGCAWPRENAPEIVDNAWRGGLVGVTFAGLTLCGMAATPALGVAGLLFGTKKLVEAAKATKEIAKVAFPGEGGSS